MLGIAALLFFVLMGVGACWALMARQNAHIRAYFGAATGLYMMMCLPSMWAFAFDFTLKAQYAAMLTAFCIAAGAWGYRLKWGGAPSGSGMPHPSMRMTLALVLPLLLIAGYLLHTHTLREVSGALHVGQSTYGDLSLHLGIATGLRDAAYPPEYTLLPGTLLGYPFLADALAASMLLLGTSLRWAFLSSALLMMALLIWGFVLLAFALTKSRRATALSVPLLLLNGGLGFLYMLDGWPKGGSRFLAIFSGFYQTPTNLPDLNLRWSNILCDMLIPQRTLLAGWAVLLPALLLLYYAIRTSKKSVFVALGLWVGMMPMVHTHSFLAMGLISLGAALYCSISAGGRGWRRAFGGFALYGALAILIALPALLTWTFPQSVGGNSLRLRFNWVNWDEHAGRLIDGYFWFWIKNVGLLYLIMLPAARCAGARQRALCWGALCVYVVAETIQFQPNPYDNNKLFYVAFLVMVPLCAKWLVRVYDRLKGIEGRRLLAGLFIAVSLLSGALTVAREWVSDYQLFSNAEVRAAQYIEQNAPGDAVFAAGTQHNNPVAALAGRNLVCGTPTFLHFHGVPYQDRQQAVWKMLTAPTENLLLFDEYGVDFVYISSYERGEFDLDEAALRSLFALWYENEEVRIYRVSAPSLE